MLPPPLRLAALDNVAAIDSLIALSARGLCGEDYSAAQIEAAIGGAWGCDTELIRDGTYFVAETDGELVACGGWSNRRTHFGGDALPGRDSEPLDPARDAARIRAFFVHPDWSRRGLARAILSRSESEAIAAGFRALELVATLTGEKFYRRYGYVASAAIDYPLRDGQTIRFVPMKKVLT
jgi:GNAT superfamily N-acetyltransferase